MSLDKSNADLVARHLAMASELIDEDPAQALAHARAARARGGRVGVVREVAGIVAYLNSEWSEAINDLRAARRISGGPGQIAMIADCERGLKRPDKALDVINDADLSVLDSDELREVKLTEAGARIDLGQEAAALVVLEGAGANSATFTAPHWRIAYMCGEICEKIDPNSAPLWFAAASELDTEGESDASER